MKAILSRSLQRTTGDITSTRYIFGQNGGRGKTERQRMVRFSIRYRLIRSFLYNLLISQFVGGNQQAMSAFQHELEFSFVRQSSHN